jgi:signal transduction histidine kinase
MNVFKNIIISFAIIFILVLVGLGLHFNRASVVMISHQDIEEEWEELSHSIAFQDALNNLIYDLTVTKNHNGLEASKFAEKVNAIRGSLDAIKICTLQLPDDMDDGDGESHTDKEHKDISALRENLEEFTEEFERNLKEDKLTPADLDGHIAKLLEIKKISVNLQKVHTQGMIAALKMANTVQQKVLKEELIISFLIILVVALASYLAVQYLHSQTLDLMNKHRIETIGMLARNFVHEIRNPLNIIKSSSGLIRDRTSKDPELSELAGYMIDEVSRIDDLLFQFLSLGDNKKQKMQSEPLNAIVDQCLVLIEGERKKSDIHIENSKDQDELSVRCNKNQIKQVIVNLLFNAIQASRKGAKILVRTYTDGSQCVLSVKDFGKGIEEHQLGKLFDPFFTTKDSGFGIGLFVVKKIIDDHGGRIEVQSQVNQGTEFKIYLNQ